MIIRNETQSRRKLVWKILFIVSSVIFGGSILALLIVVGVRIYDIAALNKQSEKLEQLKNAKEQEQLHQWEIAELKQEEKERKQREEVTVLPQYERLYEANPDIIGWLQIEGTNIDYPVMQTKEDEDYYLSYDFYGKRNRNGCLILDTDSEAGVGVAQNSYKNGLKPSANLIIHGHTMRTGDMFGKLHLYENAEYGRAHSLIRFDSLYESREYELISVFYSEVFEKQDNVFKYYDFFEAATQEEFETWYESIKSKSIYDTGVEAQYGDEFITLSACSYHKEEGRFVVIAKRIDTEKTDNE